MKYSIKWAVLPLASLALCFFTSCSSTPEEAAGGEADRAIVYQQGVPGGVAVETYNLTATVTGIDAANRKITLASPSGKKETVKCGPEVLNFDQIQVGDQLKIGVTEQVAVYMSTDAPPNNDASATVVALAPAGSKPGGVVANATQITAKISAIDLKKHKATLQFPDGSTRTVAVRKDVDLAQRKVGEDVVILVSDMMAVSVEKP